MVDSVRDVSGRLPRRQRIEPSVGLGLGMVVVYTVVFLGIAVSSGISYDDWFDTGDNAFRAAVLPLVAGSVVLVAFVAWARWDMFWKDPVRLPMSGLLWSVPVVFAVVLLVRLLGIGYGDVPGDLLAAILIAGVLVGFAEETLFRGIVLRCLRAGGRPEGRAAVWTTIAFGLFHLPNVFIGTGPAGLSQVVLATGSGAALYLFRRGSGLLVVAMVAHGAWDISAFLDGDHGSGWAHGASLGGTFVVALLGLVALVVLWRRERTTALTPQGIVTLPAS